MPLTDSSKARMWNQFAPNSATGAAATHMSLHSGYPSTTGANEIAGGSPAYARKVMTFEAVAGTELAGSLDMTNTPGFDVPVSTTVWWLGVWSAITSGTFLAWAPNGGGAYVPFGVDDAATDVLDSKAHGFSDGQTVVVWGSSLPTGISQGTVYFVISSTTDSLKLSLTSGGSAVDLTALGSGSLQRIIGEVITSQALTPNFTVTDFDLAL